MNVILSVLSLLVTLFVLAVQLGFWGGGVSARNTSDETKTPGRLRDVIDKLEMSIKEARAIAHDARNVANVARGETGACLRQCEHDIERLDRALAENTRRIDELWRGLQSVKGV